MAKRLKREQHKGAAPNAAEVTLEAAFLKNIGSVKVTPDGQQVRQVERCKVL